MNKKKIIGIPGWNSNGVFGAGINHLQFISRFGKARILMPWEEKVKIDLLYLPGGLDLSPDSYDEVPGFATTNQDVMKEFFFRKRLPLYLQDTPVFGVCLGMQMLGVAFGSKLTQDLINHPQSDDRWETAHEIINVQDPDDTFEVNSHHHQCILLSQLGKDLEPLYIAPCEEPLHEDELIVEAFRHKTLPVVGVQFHPEELFEDPFSLGAMLDLLN